MEAGHELAALQIALGMTIASVIYGLGLTILIILEYQCL